MEVHEGARVPGGRSRTLQVWGVLATMFASHWGFGTAAAPAPLPGLAFLRDG